MVVQDAWHMLQLSDVLDVELASALAEIVPLTLWEPDRSSLPIRPRFQEAERRISGSSLRIRTFPLLRGYARFPLSRLFHTGISLVRRLQAHSTSPAGTPLICTIPHFAPVAELWKGPVVYWLSDRLSEYQGANRTRIMQLDRRMVRAATLVLPNSQRIATYLIEEAGCDPDRIHILPNATREANLLPSPAPMEPASWPPSLKRVPGPVAGVLGNLAGNIDWVFLHDLLNLVPEFSWIFVGPASTPIPDSAQRRARASVLAHPRCQLTGFQPYGELVRYARIFDVAVLPYRHSEPTYSGSSTRFYEHLAACRPMIALPHVEELLHKVPLLQLVRSASQAAEALRHLHRAHFDDGLASLRWKASLTETWQRRARTLVDALSERLPHPNTSLSASQAEQKSTYSELLP